VAFFRCSAVGAGVVMMLPGLCALLLVAVTPSGSKPDPATRSAVLIALAVGFAGMLLIAWPLRRPSR
jgi:hypothetical protein